MKNKNHKTPISTGSKLKKPVFKKAKVKEVFSVRKYTFTPSVKAEAFLNTIPETTNIKDYTKEPDVKQKKRSKIISLIGLLINLGVILGIFIYSAVKGEVQPLSEFVASNPYYRYWFLCLATIFVIMVIETARFHNLIYMATGHKRKSLSYKASAIGRYYDAITPFSSGGEPAQIYYLTKHGVPADRAASVTLVRFANWQLLYVLFSIAMLVVNLCIGSLNNIVLIFSIAGIAFNFLIVALTVGLSTSKRFMPTLVVSVLKLLNKLKIVKNYQKSFLKVMRFVSNYRNSFKYYFKNFRTVFCQFALSFFSIICNVSITFFIYKIFNYHGSLNWLDVVSKIALCEMAFSVVPLPGGTGGAEASFTVVFGSLFVDRSIFWALLFWRLFTYYFYIIQGLIILLYDYIVGNKKSAKKIASGKYKLKKDKINLSK